MPKDKINEELAAIVQRATNPVSEENWQDGSTVSGEDGKTWYRYHVGEDTQLTRKPIEDMTEEDWMTTPITISGVTTSRIPQELTVKFRDPQWAGRWFNKVSGKVHSGERINVARYMGFIPATRDDLEFVFNSSGISDSDGAIEQGDLVLFKIHKAKLAAMLQRNFAESLGRGTPDSYLAKTEAGVMVPGNHRSHVNFSLTDAARNEKQGVGPVVPL